MSARLMEDVVALAEFIALLYTPYYLQSALAIEAPRLDLQLWRDLCAYETISPDGSKQRKITQATRKSVLRHLWYLSEPCVVFSLFDVKVPPQERQELATALYNTPRPQLPLDQWDNITDYMEMKIFLKDLKVINNASERCTKDITEYRNAAQDSDHREDILLVVNDHRDVFQFLRREALANVC